MWGLMPARLGGREVPRKEWTLLLLLSSVSLTIVCFHDLLPVIAFSGLQVTSKGHLIHPLCCVGPCSGPSRKGTLFCALKASPGDMAWGLSVHP